MNCLQLSQFLLDKYAVDSPARANANAGQGEVFRSVQRALTGRASSRQDIGVNDDVLLPSEKCHLYHLLSYSKEKHIEHGVVALDFDEVRRGPAVVGGRRAANFIASMTCL